MLLALKLRTVGTVFADDPLGGKSPALVTAATAGRPRLTEKCVSLLVMAIFWCLSWSTVGET